MNNKSMQALPIRFAKLLNVILIAAVFSYTWFSFYRNQMAEPFHLIGNWVLILLFAVLYYSYVRMYDGFWCQFPRYRNWYIAKHCRLQFQMQLCTL